jgi:hypothetical protein
MPHHQEFTLIRIFQRHRLFFGVLHPANITTQMKRNVQTVLLFPFFIVSVFIFQFSISNK